MNEWMNLVQIGEVTLRNGHASISISWLFKEAVIRNMEIVCDKQFADTRNQTW